MINESLRTNMSTLVCARCMVLSVLEMSLPMQRSHDTLASSISAKTGVLEYRVTAQAVTLTIGSPYAF